MYIFDDQGGMYLMGWYFGGEVTGTRYTKIPGDLSITLECTPDARVQVTSGTCGASVEYRSGIVVPRVDLSGTTRFYEPHAIKFLTGQNIRATVSLGVQPFGEPGALALIERDVGARLSQDVARRLVVFMRRDGDQRQYSQSLRLQDRLAAPFRDLVEKIEASLSARWSVDDMADACHMSRRTFQRKFAAHFGVTPAEAQAVFGPPIDYGEFVGSFGVGAATTLGDLVNAINANFPGSTASLTGTGTLVVQNNTTGATQLTVAIGDVVGNTGSTAWNGHTLQPTTIGSGLLTSSR